MSGAEALPRAEESEAPSAGTPAEATEEGSEEERGRKKEGSAETAREEEREARDRLATLERLQGEERRNIRHAQRKLVLDRMKRRYAELWLEKSAPREHVFSKRLAERGLSPQQDALLVGPRAAERAQAREGPPEKAQQQKFT